MAKVVAVALNEIDPTQVMFSEKKVNSWDFVDKKTGKKTSGSKNFVEVFYGTPGNKFAFVVENVKSFSGIQTGNNIKKGFMSISLTKEQSAAVRKSVCDVLFQLAFKHREQLYKNHKKVPTPEVLRALYDGVVKDGAEKKDKSGNYDDTSTGDIGMKVNKGQPMVDLEQCEIVDMDGSPYSWSALDGKKLSEVVFEVQEVSFTDRVKVKLVYRCIVPNEKAAVKYVTKRRLEQKEPATGSSVSSASAAATAAATSGNTSKPDAPASKPDGTGVKTESETKPEDTSSSATKKSRTA